MEPFQKRSNTARAAAAILILVLMAAPAYAFRLAVAEFTVTGHDSPEAVFAEQELSLSGLVDSATAVSVGQILGSAAVLTGECIIVGDEVLFSAMIIDSETGMVLIARSSVFSGLQPLRIIPLPAWIHSPYDPVFSSTLFRMLMIRSTTMVSGTPGPNTWRRLQQPLPSGAGMPSYMTGVRFRI